jgi:hypothetical protein
LTIGFLDPDLTHGNRKARLDNKTARLLADMARVPE